MPKKTFEVAAAANVALIVQIKDNQPTLNQHAHDIAATAAALNSATSRDKARGRDERRAVTVFDATDKFAGTDWHGHVDAIIRVQRDVYTRDSTPCVRVVAARIEWEPLGATEDGDGSIRS